MHMHTYDAVAVQREIERERRRNRISKREQRAIHALLKGSRNYRRSN